MSDNFRDIWIKSVIAFVAVTGLLFSGAFTIDAAYAKFFPKAKVTASPFHIYLAEKCSPYQAMMLSDVTAKDTQKGKRNPIVSCVGHDGIVKKTIVLTNDVLPDGKP